MGLEGADDALVRQRLGHFKQRVQLTGVVGVIVVDVRAVEASLVLKAAARAGERRKAETDGLAADAEKICGARRGQRVHHVVLAAHAQGNVRIVAAANIDVKARQPVRPDDVFRAALRGGIVVAEPENGLGDILERVFRALIVHVGDHVPADGDELCKAAEGMLHVGKILEKVEVIGLYVQNDRHGGEEAQKRVAVFAALGDDRVALADAITGMKQL